MTFKRVLLRTVFAAILAVGLPGFAAQADSATDFYAGRTISIYVGVAPGGIYSNFAQILVRHMEKHMPGKPNLIVQHMEGAGGARAVDFVYNVAPKDGTVFITPNAGVAIRVLLRMGGTKYEPEKMNWLGGWGDAVNVLSLLKGPKGPAANSLEEAKTKEVVLGAIGKSSNTYLMPALMNSQLGTRFKIITGYSGGAPIRLAIEKGEIDGWTGQWEGWKMSKPEWVRDGKLLHLVQFASKRDPELKDVPLLSEFAKNEEQRTMFKLVQSGVSDRALVGPPGVPKDRLAAVEKAYQATLRDPAFQVDAKKQEFDIDPIPGKEIQEFVEEMMRTPAATVDKMRKAMGLDGQS
jgi:tripartite-type tricarboxylate transporter receptor subunit TctC